MDTTCAIGDHEHALSERLYAIRRIEHGRNGYWNVDLMRNRQRFSKQFSDLRYGGKEAALHAALAFRTQVLLQNPPQSKLAVRQQKRRGLPGVAGVYRHPKKNKKGEETYYWVAKTRMPDGRYRTCSFSIMRYGEERAKALAEAERRKQLAETDDVPYLLSPESRRLHGQLFPEDRAYSASLADK